MKLLNLKNFNTKSIMISISGIIIALFIFSIFSHFISEEKRINLGVSFNDDCFISINGVPYKSVINSYNQNISKLQKGDTIAISKVLDDYDIVNPVISFENNNCVVKIQLDGTLIYTYGTYSKKASIIGNNRVKVPIGNNYAGKKLNIEFKLNDDSSLTTIPSIRITNAQGAANYFLADNLFHILLGVFLLFLGIMFLFFTLYSYGLRKEYRRILWLSLEAISFSLWILSCFNLLEIYFTNYVINYIIEYETIYLSFIFLILYIHDSLKSKMFRKITRCSIYVVILVSIMLNILQLLELRCFGETLIFFNIVGLISTLIAAILHVCDLRNSNLSIYLPIAEFSIIAINLGSYCLFKSLHVINAYYALKYLPIIIFIFILINFVCFIEELLRDFMTKKETQSLMDMAYLDPLTGVSNRRGFERYINELSHSLNSIIVFSFDLNNLKQTNDTYGHIAGDDLIKTFIKALKLIDNIEFIARMGGDEFTVFIKGSTNEVAEKFKKELSVIVDMLNNENTEEYQLSFACGYSIYNNSDTLDIDKLMREADSNMYVDKIAIKEGL